MQNIWKKNVFAHTLKVKIILDPTNFHCMDKKYIFLNIIFCVAQNRENHTVLLQQISLLFL